MRRTAMRSGMSAVTVALFLVTSVFLSSCATTKEVVREPVPDTFELVAGLEQTREINLEDKLTYALGTLFGFDNVVVVASSRARYGSMSESEEMPAYEGEPGRGFLRTREPGGIERQTVVVLINADALTPEQEENIEELHEELYRVVADSAGLMIDVDDQFGDSVSILFMPFAD